MPRKKTMTNAQDFKNANFCPIPAKSDQHLMKIAKITSDIFAGGKHVEEISQQYIGNCHYDFDTSRLIFDRDELIHHWGVWGYPMRLETIKLKVAGIGAVVTREHYRQCGLMTLAANASFEAMLANGYDLSILRGRHYVKFGYARAWNYVTYKLTAEDIPEMGVEYSYKTLMSKHLEDIASVYNQSYAGFTGTAIRPTYRSAPEDAMEAYHGWFDSNGYLAGFVRAVPTEDKTTLQCFEAAGDPEQGLAVLADLFRQGEYETLKFFTIPTQHPILQIVRRGSCIIEDRYFHNTGWRVKLINLKSSLEKIQPLLEIRLQRSYLMDWHGELYLDGGDQKANLAIDSGKINIIAPHKSEHAIDGGAVLARFLIGSDDPDENHPARRYHLQRGCCRVGRCVISKSSSDDEPL